MCLEATDSVDSPGIPDAAVRVLARNGLAGIRTQALCLMSIWAAVQHYAEWEAPARCLLDVPHGGALDSDPTGAEGTGCCGYAVDCNRTENHPHEADRT